MVRLSPLVLLPPVLFAGLALAFWFGMQRQDPENLPSALIGRAAPAVTDAALPGYPPVTAADLATGDVVLVNFWASWCPPCRAEHPNLMQLAADGLTVVGINFGDREGDARAYLEGAGNPYAAVAFDPGRRTAVVWGVAAPPESFLLDGEGRVVFKFIGPLVGDDFRQRFLPALQASRANGSS
jgi:cytochrome c biogenesis protein CcmG/thiol:disulfide interchange protein DsbE